MANNYFCHFYPPLVGALVGDVAATAAEELQPYFADFVTLQDTSDPILDSLVAQSIDI